MHSAPLCRPQFFFGKKRLLAVECWLAFKTSPPFARRRSISSSFCSCGLDSYDIFSRSADGSKRQLVCTDPHQVLTERDNPPPRLTNAVTGPNATALSKVTIYCARKWSCGFIRHGRQIGSNPAGNRFVSAISGCAPLGAVVGASASRRRRSSPLEWHGANGSFHSVFTGFFD